jgi:hypothetical protein
VIQVHSPPIEILTSRGANLTVGGLPFQQCAAHTFGRSLENPGTLGRAEENTAAIHLSTTLGDMLGGRFSTVGGRPLELLRR